MGMLIMGETVHMRGQGCIGTLCLPLNSSLDLKLLFSKKESLHTKYLIIDIRYLVIKPWETKQNFSHL